MSVRTVLQRGPKAKKFVAFCIDWPGWSRGATTSDGAIATLELYRTRYRPVAVLAGMGREFDGAGSLVTIEDQLGTGSTDFWGISFKPATIEEGSMDDAAIERSIALLRACWSYFDDVAARVTSEMQKGPRGGGRDRDDIVRHAVRVESLDFAKRVGLRMEEGWAMTPKGVARFRLDYVAALTSYHRGEGKPMRTGSLAFLLRHSAFHVLDHAWEMEDKDLGTARQT